MPKDNNTLVSTKYPHIDLLDDADINERVNIALEMELLDAKAAGALGYYSRALTQTTLPHSMKTLVGPDGKELREYYRSNGKSHLAIMAGPTNINGSGVPYGSIPRLLLQIISSRAKKTNSREIYLGWSMSELLHTIGVEARGGQRGAYKAVRGQAVRLFTSSINTWREESIYAERKKRWINGIKWQNLNFVEAGAIWWSPLSGKIDSLWESNVRITENAFKDVTEHAIPVDTRGLSDPTVHRSPMALDFYYWLPYRAMTTTMAGKPVMIPWQYLLKQFGCGYPDTPVGIRNFRQKARIAIAIVCSYYRHIDIDITKSEHIIIRPSMKFLAENAVQKSCFQR